MKKIFKMTLFILGLILFLFLLNYARIIIFYMYHKGEYQDAFPIYGNQNHYVPQGLTYSEKYNIVLQTSYQSDHDVSMLYVIDFEKKELIKSIMLRDMNGLDNTHHVGGITTDNQTVWISNDYQIEEYSLEEILNTEDNFVQAKKIMKLPIRGDFCTYHDGYLWIGDFYLKPFYDVPDGNPLLLGYLVEENVEYSSPELAISLPKMVQGLTFDQEHHFVVTESFTYLINSNFSIYEDVTKSRSQDTITVSGKTIPYYDLKKHFIKNIKMPPMAEALFYLNGEYYILFESSTDHYSMAYPKIQNVIRYKEK